MPKFFKDERIDAEGGLNCTGIATFSGAIVNSMANIGAQFVLDAENVEHRHKYCHGQAGTAAAERRAIYVCTSSGGATIEGFEVAIAKTAVVGNATVTVDLLKNGSSILTAAVQMNNTHALRQAVAGVLAFTTAADGDILELAISVNAGTGTLPEGVVVTLQVNEKA